MAHLRVSVQAFGKSGASSVAKAAYRAGAKLQDYTTGQAWSFERRQGVDSSEIHLPAEAPTWAADASMLWSTVQAAETRRNAQVARECLVSLPHQLPLEGMRNAARSIGQRMAQHLNTAVQVSLHRPPKRGSDKHWHLHAMFPTRRLEAHGLTTKLRQFSVYEGGRATIEWCRKMVAEAVNSALEFAGVRERVDHRSERRLDLERKAQTRQKLGHLRSWISNRRSGKLDPTAQQQHDEKLRPLNRAEIKQAIATLKEKASGKYKGFGR